MRLSKRFAIALGCWSSWRISWCNGLSPSQQGQVEQYRMHDNLACLGRGRYPYSKVDVYRSEVQALFTET